LTTARAAWNVCGRSILRPGRRITAFASDTQYKGTARAVGYFGAAASTKYGSIITIAFA